LWVSSIVRLVQLVENLEVLDNDRLVREAMLKREGVPRGKIVIARLLRGGPPLATLWRTYAFKVNSIACVIRAYRGQFGSPFV
jgi:hypothetical protein